MPKKKILIVILLFSLFIMVACAKEDPINAARNDVIKKWTTAAGELGTSKFIEDIYKEYPDDDVISNIYYYCIAKEQYDLYKSLDESEYLSRSIEYLLKIDPDYSGELSDEIHSFIFQLTPSGISASEHQEAEKKENTYNNLTNSDKKKICEYIEDRYDYYDKINGGYSGDKYSDTIMQEAADKYDLTTTQIEIIWMNMYSY